MYMYIYVHIYVYMYIIYVYIYMYIHVDLYVCKYISYIEKLGACEVLAGDISSSMDALAFYSYWSLIAIRSFARC